MQGNSTQPWGGFNCSSRNALYQLYTFQASYKTPVNIGLVCVMRFTLSHFREGSPLNISPACDNTFNAIFCCNLEPLQIFERCHIPFKKSPICQPGGPFRPKVSGAPFLREMGRGRTGLWRRIFVKTPVASSRQISELYYVNWDN